MRTLEISKASQPLADYAARLGSESLVITSNRKPVAALVSLKDMDRESLALSLSPEFARIMRDAQAGAARGEVFSLEQVRQELLPKNPARKARSSAGPRRSPPRKRRPV